MEMEANKMQWRMEQSGIIRLFVQLGKDIQKVCVQWDGTLESVPTAWRNVMVASKNDNGWFTFENQIMALKGIALLLEEDAIHEAIAPYKEKFADHTPKTVAVIMAGNIPAVNFLDFMCVVLAGFKFVGKLSSTDQHLLPFLASELTELEPLLRPFIHFEKDTIQTKFDAVIATGSNNTARYFEYYFGRYPHVIRKNRSSVAVLTGNESADDLKKLGDDISTFYGMGCRNVSKIFVPKGYDLIPLLQTLEQFTHLTDNHKYVNNYEYHRSLFLLNGNHFYDNNVILLQENHKSAAPVGTVFYEYYDSLEDISAQLWRDEKNIQCTAANGQKLFPRQVDLGGTQCPTISDYPDGVDIFGFLAGLA